jgi:hypothetical protein
VARYSITGDAQPACPEGIFRTEFIAPSIPLEHIVYLGEGHTPLVEANDRLKEMIGLSFYFKNDGMNPSASFKDRGMACALSYINHFAKKEKIDSLLAICASTGDTSASAALYGAYLQDSHPNLPCFSSWQSHPTSSFPSLWGAGQRCWKFQGCLMTA